MITVGDTMKSRIFLLNHPSSLGRLAEWVNGDVHFAKVSCPLNGGHQRSGKRLDELSIALPHADVEDFVWTWYAECLLQEHVLEFFREHGITGYQLKRVRACIRNRPSMSPPVLWELVVTGWAGQASPNSGVKLLEKCDGCGHMIYSQFSSSQELIDESKWDGADIFMVWPMPKFIFVTQRVADIIRHHKLTGVELTEVNDLQPAEGKRPTFSPGRLSNYMPEDRARQLGEPLGIF
jgi:hypothetical protein